LSAESLTCSKIVSSKEGQWHTGENTTPSLHNMSSCEHQRQQ